MDVKSFIKASRLRTLPLSVSGIIIGSYLGVDYVNAITPGSVKIVTWLTPTFWLAIFTTVGFQVLSNFANDYGDGIKGTDKNRTGEERMVSSGAITPKQMKTAMIITTVVTLVIALLLIYVAFGKDNFGYSLLFLFLGIASITAAIKYTVGNSAYGYSGFGDIFVFLFFGLLSVLGSYFLFAKQMNLFIFLPAISIGLLSTAVLNLNNLRDREEDEKNSKNTLVVKLGVRNAKRYHYLLILTALISALIYVFSNYSSALQFIFLVAFIPLLINIKTVAKNTIASKLDKELKKVAISTFLFAILFSLGNTIF